VEVIILYPKIRRKEEFTSLQVSWPWPRQYSTYILELMSAHEARAADRSIADDNFTLHDPNNSARGIDMVVDERRQIT
jgi:hypothetical protein